jgi:hypothetical protein
MRGGSRPGLVKIFPSGVSAPCHLLSNVRLVEDTGLTFIDDFFLPRTSGPFEPLGDHWSQASWRPGAPEVITRTNQAFAYTLSQRPRELTNRGAVYDDVGIDTTEEYTITLRVGENRLFSNTNVRSPIFGEYSVFVRMDDANPNVLVSGVEVRFFAALGDGRVSIASNGTTTTTSALFDVGDFARMDVVVGTLDTVTVRVDGVEVLSSISVDSHAGSRFGFGIAGTLSSDIPNETLRVVESISARFVGDIGPAAPNRNVVVAAGGTNAASSELDIKYEDIPGTLVAVGTVGVGGADITNANARQLQAAELLGKMYIVGEDGNTEVWRFDPTGSGTIIDLTTATTSTEQPPNDCLAVAAWRNRICVVSRDDQQNVYMSRVSDPADWDRAALPVGSGVALNTTGVDSGKLGEPVNAMIPHSDDYMLIGCLNSLWVLRGDPTLGGQLDRLSSSIGIAAPQAWARGPNGETIFLSNDGIYSIPAGVLAYPESVSREKLPEELRDVDVNNNRILMAYDVRNRGVFIGITPMLAGGGTYFWFDWEFKGFWPMRFNKSHEPTALAFRTADSPFDQHLMFGCRDGEIRVFDNNAHDDDGTDFASELLIGPIALGGGGYFDGMLLEIVGQTGVGSGDVTCEVKVGNSVESAFNATPRSAFTFRAGKNLTHRPRLRGNACFLRLSSSGGSAWAMENLTVVRERLGKQRL